MIAKVINWSNGMVMVFDENGKQLPQFQGRCEDVMTKILSASSPSTQFQNGNWNKGELGNEGKE